MFGVQFELQLCIFDGNVCTADAHIGDAECSFVGKIRVIVRQPGRAFRHQFGCLFALADFALVA